MMKMKNYLDILPEDLSYYIWKLCYNDVIKEIGNFDKEIKEINKIIHSDKYRQLHAIMLEERPIVWPIIKKIINNKLKLWQVLNQDDYIFFKKSYKLHLVENIKIYRNMSLEESFIAYMMMYVWH